MYIKNLLCTRTVLDAGSITMNKMGKIANFMEAGFSKPRQGDRQYSCNNKNPTPSTPKDQNKQRKPQYEF